MRGIILKPVVAAITLSAFIAGATAHAAVGWKVFATATDDSEYYSSASADAQVQAPNALAVRVTGNGVETVSWRVSCEFDKKPARAGLYVVSIANAHSCNLYGSAGGGEGKVTYQLLKR